MKLISYWVDSGNSPKEIHTDDGMVLIIGYYNHKNQHAKGEKALGVHWGNYPQSRGVLSPCVIPTSSEFKEQLPSNEAASKLALQ